MAEDRAHRCASGRADAHRGDFALDILLGFHHLAFLHLYIFAFLSTARLRRGILNRQNAHLRREQPAIHLNRLERQVHRRLPAEYREALRSDHAAHMPVDARARRQDQLPTHVHRFSDNRGERISVARDRGAQPVQQN